MSDFLDDRLAALGSTPVPPLAPAELVRRRGEQRRTRGRLLAGAAGLALVVAAGATAYGVTTDRDHGALQYAPGPSGEPSPAPSGAGPAGVVAGPPADGDVVLAVGGGAQTRADGTAATTSLSLYRLRGGESAEPVRTLVAPRADGNLYDVSVSAGPTPTTCAVWDLDPQDPGGTELRCYGWGDSEGTVVRTGSSDPRHVALSPDGRSVAWVDSDANESLWVGRLQDGQVAAVREYVGDPAQPANAFVGADDLAWAGPGALAISLAGQDDEGSGLRMFVPGTTQGGWLGQAEVRPPSADRQRRYYVYDGVRSATATTAWAIERAKLYLEDRSLPAPRAVEIELRSGRVKAVVSEPGKGRDVVEVSGSSRAVVYVTAARPDGSDRRVYVRYPGQAHGVEITGLPDSRMVVAGG